MKIYDLKILEGKNLKGKENLIYLNLVNGERNLVYRIIEDYEYVCRRLDIEGKELDVIYKSDGAEIWFTYDRLNLSIYILESLVDNIVIEKILSTAFNMKQQDWSYNLIQECRNEGIKFIHIDDENIQIGYGKNSIILSKDEYEHKSFNKDILKNRGFIPIVSVTGTNGKTTTVRLIYNILKELGYYCGASTTGSIVIGNEVVKEGDTTGFYSAREVLKNNKVDVAILETARGGIIKKGLGYDKAKVSIITSLSEDHIGMGGVDDLKQLAKVKALTAQGLDDDGKLVIKAESILYEELKDNEKLVIFNDFENDIIDKQIEKGKEAWYVENDYLVCFKNNLKKKIINIKEIPFTHFGLSKSNINNVICSIIATEKIHGNLEEVIQVLKNIKCNLDVNPGRQNIIGIDNYKLILDYGHNPEAFEEVFNLAKKLKPSKITAVISAPGDRKNLYIKKLGEVAAKNCDEIVIREQEDRRGRATSEVANILKEAILVNGFSKEKIRIILKEEDAIIEVMKNAKAEEVIILFTQCLNVVIPKIEQYLGRKLY